MNDRIRALRERSLKARPTLSAERALLVTEFYASDAAKGLSPPVLRAMAFKHILGRKAIFVDDGELIVGERGPAPKATPTYPEICCHTLEDLDLLDGRPKLPYKVDAATRQAFAERIIPFWKGRTLREKLFASMTGDWLKAYKAGLFTEFLEQRAPGHTVLDDKIYRLGLLGLKERVRSAVDALDPRDPARGRKLEELRAMEIAADALVAYAGRHAARAKELAAAEPDPARRKELERIARTCERVPAHPPRDLWEALQSYWFVHLGVITELNGWDSFSPGRLDQHLLPFYEKGLKDGTLTRESAVELLQAFWIKFNNQPAPPKVGVTAEESSTYTDFALVNLGGLRADGADAVNEVSFLLLDVVEEMRLLQPSSMVQVAQVSPDAFLERALRIVKTGYGQPSLFNSDAIVAELLRQGKSAEDARCGGASGCVETGAFGKESYILSGYFNLPKMLELALNDGRDPRTGAQLGPRTGDAATMGFEELFEAFAKQVGFFASVKIRGNNAIERLYAEQVPAPFLSLLVDDCIARGTDYHEGGARYNTTYIQGVGLGSITDSLASLKSNAFDKKVISMGDMLAALKNDFEGQESLRQRLVNKTPKWGNDDDDADALALRVFETFFGAVDGVPNTKGGHHRINLLPTTSHVYFGRVTGALPDGRKAGEPLSEGISPIQGADRKGPTAVMKSVGKLDHSRTGGTLLNQKFTPQLLADAKGLDSLADLVRVHFAQGSHHVQFNVVTAETLREAKLHPEKHRDLIVRVAGYSDYFVDLGESLQDEIIRRTEHGA
jgi:pyruvate formate-lyase/glycerol dehydratase family glycyl radical enzyme